MITRSANAFVLTVAIAVTIAFFTACSGSSTNARNAAPGSTPRLTSSQTSTDPQSSDSHSTDAARQPSTTVGRSTPSIDTGELTTGDTEFRSGAEVLADTDFAALRGKRVGAIVNQTSLVDGRRLIDLLAQHPDIDLVRLFAPEHGIDGTLAAGELLGDSVDEATGVSVVSLYGSTRQPTEEMFDDLDVVIFDLQDVGSRSYTYISTMGLAMTTAIETETEFVVLDRPNPAGGDRIGGIVLEPSQTSFIGRFPLPNVHGLTVGEVATMIVDQHWLPDVDGLDLTVVPMQGWSRGRRWHELGRPWVAPSPRLPTADLALLYTGTVLLAGTSISDGSGTATPFALAGAPFIESGGELAATLDAQRIPGVRFEAATFTPRSIPGISPSPLHEGAPLEGVRLVITDHDTIDPLRVAIEMLVVFQAASTAAGPTIVTDPAAFDLVAGSPDLRRWIEQGDTADVIIERMQPGLDDFDERRRSALLYD